MKRRKPGGLTLEDTLREILVRRDADDLTLSGDTYYLYQYDIFPMCTDDDITRLYVDTSNMFLLNWLGMRRAEAYRYERAFLSYVGVEGTTLGDPIDGLPTSLCETGDGYEWATCDFTLEGFGRLIASGPVRSNGGNEIPYCRRQPRWRIDGTLIEDQDEWDLAMLMGVTTTNLAKRVIVGNKTTPFDADGLDRLIKTGYTNRDGLACPLMDSTIIDWGGGPMCGGTLGDPLADPVIPSDFAADTPDVNGIVLDPANNAAFLNLYFVLREVYYRNLERIELAPTLGAPSEGDLAIFMPRHAIRCLVDCAVCWLECDGDFVRMDSDRAIQRRNQLMRGFEGRPMIEFDGFRVPILPLNPMTGGATGEAPSGLLDNADGTVNIYMLWRAVGGRTVMTLEYNSLADAKGWGYVWNENAQILTWQNVDNLCIQTHMATTWRMYLDAPWLQTRIENVACTSGVYNTDVYPFATFPASLPDNVYQNR